MASSNFVDYVKINCRSGAGGAGSVHFHRDKFTAKGGPDGGDGGRGGHIIIRGNKQLWTLIHLKYRKHIMAVDGEKGRKSLQTGADGKDHGIGEGLDAVLYDPADRAHRRWAGRLLVLSGHGDAGFVQESFCPLRFSRRADHQRRVVVRDEPEGREL